MGPRLHRHLQCAVLDPLPPFIQQFINADVLHEGIAVTILRHDRMVPGKKGVGNGAGVSNHRHPPGGR